MDGIEDHFEPGVVFLFKGGQLAGQIGMRREDTKQRSRRSRARYTWNMLQTKEILDAALQLPDKDRELLVDELSASLHSGFASTEIEQSWASEIERRSAEIDTGKAVLRDWDEVRDEILADLRDRP